MKSLTTFIMEQVSLLIGGVILRSLYSLLCMLCKCFYIHYVDATFANVTSTSKHVGEPHSFLHDTNGFQVYILSCWFLCGVYACIVYLQRESSRS